MHPTWTDPNRERKGQKVAIHAILPGLDCSCPASASKKRFSSATMWSEPIANHLEPLRYFRYWHIVIRSSKFYLYCLKSQFFLKGLYNTTPSIAQYSTRHPLSSDMCFTWRNKGKVKREWRGMRVWGKVERKIVILYQTGERERGSDGSRGVPLW